MIYWATVIMMTKRLTTRYETGQVPQPRWGGNWQPATPATWGS